MRTMITGGAGFIGSHLAMRLLKRGENVVVVDIQESNQHMDELAKAYPKTFEYHCSDLVYNVPKIQHVDRIYHLAGAIGTKQLVNPAFDVLFINQMLMRNILNVYGNSIAKIVFTSTAEVYTGQLVPMPTDEKVPIGWNNTSDARWAYSMSKFYSEQLLRSFEGKNHTPKWAIARLSNVYGPNMQQDYVVKSLIQRIQAGESPLELQSALDTRPFTFVLDTVRGLIAMMDSDKANGEIINIGLDREVSITELATVILGTMGKNKYDVLPHATMPAERRLPNVNKAYVLLDWKPTVEIEEGIALTVPYYQGVKK